MDPVSRPLSKEQPQRLIGPFNSTTPHGTWVDQPFLVDTDGAFLNHTSSNPGWRDAKGAYDAGSEWSAIKSDYVSSGIDADLTCYPGFGDTAWGYRGPVEVGGSSYTSKEDFLSFCDFGTNETDLAAFGTLAINRCLPTNPISNLPEAIGELIIDGLPAAVGASILKRGKVTPSLVAGEYLNGVFGLAPFYSDLQAFVDSATRANEIIAQYVKDAGKPIRRRYETDPVISSFEDNSHRTESGYEKHIAGLCQSDTFGFTTPILGGWPGTRTDHYTVEKRTWYSGAFTYYLPEVGLGTKGQLARELAEQRKLYGSIGASTAWNLLPFSWAADWFTNAGSLIGNLDAFSKDGLVMLWGYVMEKLNVTCRRRVEGAVVGCQTAGTPLPSVIETTLSVLYQRRRKATPFAFGLHGNLSELSLRQKAILGAIGISTL